MSIPPLSDKKIVDSWFKNASPWITAVHQDQIESRKICTNQAIVEAVLRFAPKTIIDLGCGEGWLARAFSERGLRVTGIDIVPELVEQAQKAGKGDFRVLSYEEIASGKLEAAVDALVCNFSLLGKESVEGIFHAAPKLLNPQGKLIVQTIHPLMAHGDEPYRDGWRKGSWDGFSSEFTDPAPWYFRTLESWINLFQNNQFYLRELREPIHPKSGKPASVIFVGEVRQVSLINKFNCL